MEKFLAVIMAMIAACSMNANAQNLIFTYGVEDLPVGLIRSVLVPYSGLFKNSDVRLPTTYNCQVLSMEYKIVSGWSANLSYISPFSADGAAKDERLVKIPFSVITLSGAEYDNLKSYSQVIHPEIERLRLGITRYFQDGDKHYYVYATGGIVYNHAVVYADSTESLDDKYANINESITNSSRTDFSGYNGFAGLGFRYNWKRVVVNAYTIIDMGYRSNFEETTYDNLNISSIPSRLSHSSGTLMIGNGFMYGINVGIRI